jgi:cell division protein FtsL
MKGDRSSRAWRTSPPARRTSRGSRPKSPARRSTRTRSTGAARRRPPGRRVPFLIASAFLVGALVLSVATLQALISQNSFRLRELSRRGAVLQESVGRLNLEVARLSSPGRIARMARRSGLQLPGEVHVLPIDGEDSLGNVQSGPGFAMKSAPGESP